jgi:cytochrome c-type biogenesis protein
MEFLTNFLENSTMPWLTALVLGLMTAISPCPLAMNITAVGFISRDIEDRNRVFFNGLLYTLGRAITYSALALMIFFGADQLKFSGFFQQHGEKIAGPAACHNRFVHARCIQNKLPGFSGLTSRMQNKKKWSYTDAVLLGLLFALAFCPYSGVLYFGMLVPMTVSSTSGLYLPIIFAIATGSR